MDQAPPNWKNIHRDTHKEGIEFLDRNFIGTISITISKLLHTPDLPPFKTETYFSFLKVNGSGKGRWTFPGFLCHVGSLGGINIQ